MSGSRNVESGHPSAERGSRRRWIRRTFSLALAAAAVCGALFAAAGAASPTCTIYWTGKTSGNWGTATNWSLTNNGSSAGRVPTSTDYVCMSTAPTTATVDLTGTSTVDGINWPQAGSVNPSLEVDGTLTVGTSSVANASTIQQLTIDGTLTSYKTEALSTANFTFNGGTLRGTGTLTSTGPATISNEPSLGVSGTASSAAHLILQGTTSLSAAVLFYDGSELENQGTLNLADDTDLSNQDGNSGNELVNDSGASVVYAGSSSSQSATVNETAVNKGTVSVTEGTLSFGSGSGTGTDTGTFTAASGATLDLGGTRTEGSGATITGAGEVDITGTATFTAAANLTNTGTFEVDGTLIVSSGINLTAANLTLNGDLEGPGSLTVSGPATTDVSTSLGGYGTGVHLILQGTTNLASDTGVYFYNGSELENQGTLNLADGTVLGNQDGNAGNELVNDSGASVVYAGSNSGQTATVQIAATNKGTVKVTKGTLSFGDGSASGTDTGTFTAASGATLDLGGTRTEGSGATITGAGEVDITGTATFTAAANLTDTGTFEVDGTLGVSSGINLTAANLTLNNGGDIEGPGSLTVTGTATIAAGYLGEYGAAAHLILKGTTTTTGSSYIYLYNGSELENRGTLNLADGSVLGNADGNAGNELVNDSGASVVYAGSSSSQTATVGVAAVNTGTVSVTEGTLSFGSGSASGTDTGTFTAASGATLDLGGTRTEGSGATIAGAGEVDITGTATFTAASNLTNTGTFEVDGTLGVASGVNVTAANLTDTDSGYLEGPGSLTVTGPATLGDAYLGVDGTGVHLILQGTTNLTSDTGVYFYNGSELENQGTLNLADYAGLYNEDGNAGNELVNDSGASVVYAGSSGSPNATVQVAAINQGTVKVTEGTLYFGSGSASGTDTGTFTAASGATLNLGGIRTEGSGATITGAGEVDISGTATFTATSNLTNTGNFEVDGTLIVNSGITLTTANLNVYGTINGPGGVTVSGPATLQNGSELGTYNDGGATATHLVLQGTTSVLGGVALNDGSEIENQSTLNLADSSYLDNNDGNTGNELVNDAGATISFAGTGSSPSAAVDLPLNNNGTISASKGTLSLPDLSNLSSGGTLMGGTYTTGGGVLSLANTITTNAATVTLGVSPSAIDSGSSNALAALLTNSGSLTLQRSLTLTGALTNSGTLTAQNSSTLQTSKFTQTGGTTTVVGGSTLKSTSGTVAINGGQLTGTGAVTGNVAGGGTIVPIGTVAGPLSVSGTYNSTAGTLQIPISGTTPAGTAYGQLSVGGAATLGGTLQISTASGYTPPIGTQYTILKAGSISGTFANVTGAQLANERYAISYTATTVVATVQAVPPTVTSVSPSSGPTGGGPSVTISGTGFTNASGVSFGTTAATSYTVNSSTQITATAPAHSAGTVDVTVTTPGGTSATSSADQFTYIPAPTVTNVSPSSGPASGGTSVTITGTGFTGATGVSFGSNPATSFTVVSSTQITAVSPAGSGTVDITVTTPSGTSATSSADQFTYIPAPTVTGVSPSSGPPAGGTTVTITGTGFTGATGVAFGSNQATSYTINSATQITATAPAGSGTVDVTVTTPGATSATSSADQYTYVASTPTVTNVSPSAGPAGGGTTVTITGTGFTGATGVSFGTTAATSYTVNSSTQITATAPAHSAGTVDVTVTTPGGTSATSSADQYTFVAAPTVTKISPTSGPTTGGTTVTITGTGFTGATSVSFGTTAATSYTVKSATQITATSPAHASGAVDITVTTTGGTSATSTKDRFTYAAPPTVTAVTPNAGPTAGGTTVTITGTGFSAASTVYFGSTPATSVTYVSSSKLSATSPAETAGTVDVTATGTGGTSATSSKDLFAYGAPTVTSFTPTSGITGSKVTIGGTGFVSGVTVQFGSLSSPTVTLSSGTQLVAVVPNGATPGTISVTNGQGTGTSSGSFTPTLSISGFSPSSGPVGTVVTINGIGFNSKSTVKFNKIAAHVTFVSSTELQATVPTSATTGTITVTNSQAPTGTVTSPTSFTVN